MFKRTLLGRLFIRTVVTLTPVFAQTEDPCVLQEGGTGDEETLYVVCNVCGDAIIDDAEECDDGNTVDGDGCNSSCMGESVLLETGPDGDSSAGPNQVLPKELLGVGPVDETITLNPQAQAYEQPASPTEMQSTGAPTIASLIAARNIKQAQLAKAATLGSNNIILPNRLAATGGTENLIALLMVVLGSLGVRGSIRFVK